jgi:hypothetical protein
MPKKFEDILAQCIDDIKAGRCCVEDCLERYPSLSKRLEPLLRLALKIQEPPDVRPSSAFKVRARVQLMEQIHAGQVVTKWPESRYKSQTSLIPQKRRFSMIAIIVAAILAVSALGGGTAYASQDSLPGDVLYPVKLGTEQARLMLTANDVAKAELALSFAETRVEEMTALAERGRPENLNLALAKYDNAVTMAIAKIEEASSKGLATANTSALVAEATAKHLSVLDRVYDKVPAEAKVAIERARQVSLKGQENALAALARENPVKAAEINLATIEERLNRVRAKAEQNDVEEVENALGQYEELTRFGEEISQIAQGVGKGTATVEELLAKASSRHLRTLDEIHDRVPAKAEPAIEQARAATVNGLGNALTALAKEDPVRAMELNLAAMEERLNRVRAKAGENDIEETEDALQQFKEMAKFGEEISQIAQGLGKDVAKVEELVAKATSIHLEVLAKVYEKVPGPAKEAIQRAIDESVKGYQGAIEALKKIGAPGNIPQKPPIPEEIPPLPKGIPNEVKEKIQKPEVPGPEASDDETRGVTQEEEEEQELPGPASERGRRP